AQVDPSAEPPADMPDAGPRRLTFAELVSSYEKLLLGLAPDHRVGELAGWMLLAYKDKDPTMVEVLRQAGTAAGMDVARVEKAVSSLSAPPPPLTDVEH